MKRMRAFLCILLAMVTVLTLASCSAANGDESMGDVMSPIFGFVDQDKYDSVVGEPERGEELPPAENPFVNTEDNNVSTFSADVDTASYAYFRKLVNSYTWEDLKNSASAFRTEEFINYFDYEAPQPKENELFGVEAEIFSCPWNQQNKILRLTLQAETAVNTVGNNLVFLIDVSGSMSSMDKLPLLKKAFSTLVRQLSPNDVVSIVTYSGKEEVVLSGARGNETERILNAVNSLKASGSTNGEAGLAKAYQVAEANYLQGGNNRIIMASDGDLNVGISSAEELKRYIENKRNQGVYISVLGFGTGNYRDANMEALADNGNGVYYYIDGESEAEKVFGTDLLGTLYTVAEDVKLQLTFDPALVKSFRLIGYENRILDKEDFEDDTKDAGEVGAGHQVTVCYELSVTEGAEAAQIPWANLAIRYKKPGETLSLLNEYGLGSALIREELDADSKFLICVIETVMLLRESQYLNPNMTLETVFGQLEGLDLARHPERMEFYQLLKKLR